MSFTFRGSGAGLPHHVSHTCCHAWRHRHLGATESPQHRHRGLQRHSIIRRGFGDDLLDFIEGMSSAECLSWAMQTIWLDAACGAASGQAFCNQVLVYYGMLDKQYS